MLKCRDVPVRLDEASVGSLSLPRRVGLRFHLMMCRHCRRFARQYGVMLRVLALRRTHASDAEVTRVVERVRASEAQSGRPFVPDTDGD